MVQRAVAEFPWYRFHRLALAEVLRSTGRAGEAKSMLDELRHWVAHTH
jgi:hypothetical protein